MGFKYEFSGYATKNNLKCSDGRVIRQNAFAEQDGEIVPLVWNHQHDSEDRVLGHALLENRNDGVYAYCALNKTESGQTAKELVHNGDVKSLSIYANKLKQKGSDVVHGVIRELSLVLSGANPGAQIDFVMAHSDDGEEYLSGVVADYDQSVELYHADKKQKAEIVKEKPKEDKKMPKDEKTPKGEKNEENEENKKSEKTVQEVLDGMDEDEKKLLYAVVGMALEEGNEGEKMKHNAFDNDHENEVNVLTHADEEQIMKNAKSSSFGSFRAALEDYVNNNNLQHGVIDGEVLDTLFPEFKDVRPGEPETLMDDQAWVMPIINGMNKVPYSRVRTRQLDARDRRDFLNGKGYQKGKIKKELGDVKLISRKTEPITVYVKDSMNRDDIVDFTDFDIVAYQWKLMKSLLYKEIATAVLIGDGRDDGDEDKIDENNIRPIWTDDELYTIHRDIDLTDAKTKIQGSKTGEHFSDNYIYSEAIIEQSLYAREKYKGSGNLTFYCTPHLVNVMLLARDFNGRRMYSTINDLKAALNVRDIITIEQFDNLVRTDKNDLSKHKLLGIYVNMADYTAGSTKGGEITQFKQFDIDFNKEKYLIETRMSGALTRVKSAIVLEEPVA